MAVFIAATKFPKPLTAALALLLQPIKVGGETERGGVAMVITITLSPRCESSSGVCIVRHVASVITKTACPQSRTLTLKRAPLAGTVLGATLAMSGRDEVTE